MLAHERLYCTASYLPHSIAPISLWVEPSPNIRVCAEHGMKKLQSQAAGGRKRETGHTHKAIKVNIINLMQYLSTLEKKN